jgi:hypothetical protein
VPEPGRHLNPGRQRDRHLDGIVSHGYDKHVVRGKEFGKPNGFTENDYRKSAEKLLNQGSIGHAIEQSGATNYLIGDRKLGTVTYLNTRHPNKSTHFVPPVGVEKHISRKLSQVPPSSRHKLELSRIRSAPVAANSAPKPVTAKASGPPKPVVKATPPKAPPPRSVATRPPVPRPAAKPPVKTPQPLGVKPPAPKPPGKLPPPPPMRPKPPPLPRQPGKPSGPMGPGGPRR